MDMSLMVEFNFDSFVEEFEPMPNQFNKDASFCGYMFETYGEESEFIKLESQKNPKNIWTALDDDERGVVIINGYYVLDSIGYFISKKEFPDGVTYQIVD